MSYPPSIFCGESPRFAGSLSGVYNEGVPRSCEIGDGKEVAHQMGEEIKELVELAKADTAEYQRPYR